MRVLFVASEAAPFSKTGGLGDVAGSLPPALREAGAEVSVFLPLYGSNKKTFRLEPTGYGGGMKSGGSVWEYGVLFAGDGVYFVDCPAFFDRKELYGTRAGEYSDNPLRFSFFCRAVLETASAMGLEPDVVHVHDWQTALIPVYLRTTHASLLPGAASLLTIHNLGYQGLFAPSAISDTALPEYLYGNGTMEYYGHLNFLKGGIETADAINTVSPAYAREIQTQEMGFGLDGVLRRRADRLTGIINGIDYSVWDPSTDKYLPSRYSADSLEGKAATKKAFSEKAGFDDPSLPLAGVVSRLAQQKGIDHVVRAAHRMVRLGLNVAVLGRGEQELENALSALAKDLRGRFWLSMKHDEVSAHMVYAASDLFLMPSRYEPCGLSQMIAMRYGAIPVARRTGGIGDTVQDMTATGEGTGFTYEDDGTGALKECIKRALVAYANRGQWLGLMRRAMNADFSWQASALRYMNLYRAMTAGTSPGGRP